MNKKIKLVVFVAVIVMIIIYMIYYASQPMEVETQILDVSDSKISFKETGYVEKENNLVNVYPLASGKVEEIYVDEDVYVNKDDVLATIDNSNIAYEIESLKAQNNSLEAQKASVYTENQANVDSLISQKASLEGELSTIDASRDKESVSNESLIETQQYVIEQSEILLNNANDELEKNELLYNQGIISKNEYNEYVLQQDNAQIDYNEALEQMDALKSNTITSDDYYDASKITIEAQIDGINTSLLRDNVTPTIEYYNALIAQTNTQIASLENSTDDLAITAPVSGVIEDMFLDDSNVGSPSVVAFTISPEDEEEYVSVNVNTRDIGTVNIGDDVEIVFNERSGDIIIPGKVMEIDDMAISEVSSLGLDERKVEVKIEPEANDYLQNGYDVDVEFTISDEGNQIVVPNSSLYKKDDEDYVLIIQDGEVVEQKVSLGTELEGETVITEGLSIGDELITDLDADGLEVGAKAKGY